MAKRVDKPVRLYVLTILVVVGYGLLPFVSVFPLSHGSFLLIGPRFLPFNGSVQVLYGTDGEISLVLLIVTLALSFFSVASAIVAFLGITEGRVAALIFLTLNVAWWFFLVVTAIMNDDVDAASSINFLSQLIFPSIWLGIIWWNFTRQDISAYLKYKSEVDT